MIKKTKEIYKDVIGLTWLDDCDKVHYVHNPKWNEVWFSASEVDKMISHKDRLISDLENGQEHMNELFIEQRKEELEQLRQEVDKVIYVLLQAHSGREWGRMSPDTAVTQYRGILKPLLHEKIDSVFAQYGVDSGSSNKDELVNKSYVKGAIPSNPNKCPKCNRIIYHGETIITLHSGCYKEI